MKHMSAKQIALDLIGTLPDDISEDGLMSQLRFALTIHRRGEEAARGENLIPHAEVKRRPLYVVGKQVGFDRAKSVPLRRSESAAS